MYIESVHEGIEQKQRLNFNHTTTIIDILRLVVHLMYDLGQQSIHLNRQNIKLVLRHILIL